MKDRLVRGLGNLDLEEETKKRVGRIPVLPEKEGERKKARRSPREKDIDINIKIRR